MPFTKLLTGLVQSDELDRVIWPPMKMLAAHIASGIERELQAGRWKHCAVYENELTRIWPLDQKDREANIAQFAKEHGFRLTFYKAGLCAIFTTAKD